MLNLDNLSTEAKIGEILILVDLILGVVGLAFIFMPFAGFSFMSFGMGFGFFAAYFVIYAILKIIGLILGVLALKAASNGDFHMAGILAGVSSLLPPLSIIMIIGAALCFLSPEGKKSAPKVSAVKSTGPLIPQG